MAATTLSGVMGRAQEAHASAKQMVEAMIAREQKASHDPVHYAYLSEERSERTKGHLWTERMVETDWGTVRLLLAVDGKKLTTDQAFVERMRLADETANPEAYKQQELKQEDGERCQHMLAVLQRAFTFDVLGADSQETRIGYRPDPAFSPQTMEERALHGMMGTVVLDTKTLRLRRLNGHAPSDISLGFGPFATIRAGSAFSTLREPIQEAIWKTSRVQTIIQGKALLLKTIARQQDYTHREFRRLPVGLGLKEAVLLAEQ